MLLKYKRDSSNTTLCSDIYYTKLLIESSILAVSVILK